MKRSYILSVLLCLLVLGRIAVGASAQSGDTEPPTRSSEPVPMAPAQTPEVVGYPVSASLRPTPNPSYTTSNGLTMSGTEIQLGGTLNQTTTISLDAYNLLFGGTGNIGIGTANPAGKLVDAGNFAVGGKSFFGRTTSLSNVFDQALVEVDVRNRNNVSGMWIVGDSINGAPLLKLHKTGNGPLFYVSETLGSFLFEVSGTGEYLFDTLDNQGYFRPRLGIQAGAAAGQGFIKTYDPIMVRAANNPKQTVLQQWQDSAGAPISTVDVKGQVGIRTGGAAPRAALDVNGDASIAGALKGKAIQKGICTTESISAPGLYDCSVTFAQAFANRPVVVSTPSNDGTGDLDVQVVRIQKGSPTTTSVTFQVRVTNVLAQGTYQVHWLALEQ